MILLDTNVVSEPMRPVADPGVAAWIDAQDPATLYLSAVTLAELRYGVAMLPRGKRRDRLHLRLENEIVATFAERIVVFDAPASRAYAELRARARAGGRTIAVADGLIAASALARGMTLATRDTGPFEAAGLPVINPWRPVR